MRVDRFDVVRLTAVDQKSVAEFLNRRVSDLLRYRRIHAAIHLVHGRVRRFEKIFKIPDDVKRHPAKPRVIHAVRVFLFDAKIVPDVRLRKHVLFFHKFHVIDGKVFVDIVDEQGFFGVDIFD